MTTDPTNLKTLARELIATAEAAGRAIMKVYEGDDFGNWAPANLGVGFNDGRAWISIFQNLPTQKYVKLPYTVEIVGGSSKCKYQNGVYYTGDDYATTSDVGCTVSADSGELTYILS